MRNKRYNAYSVVATHVKWPRVDFAFARQPWAVKGTTLTALHSENIHGNRCIYWNISATPTTLRGERIHYGGYIHWNNGTFGRLFIRMLPSIVLWNACFNAIGVALSKRNSPWIQTWENVNKNIKRTFQRRRCCAFDSPGLPNDSAGYPGLAYGLRGTTP